MMMDLQALKQELKQLMIEQLDLRGKQPADIDDEAPLFGAGLGLDSLDALQLAMAVEERFGVSVPEGEAAREVFASVESLANFVAGAKSA
ncbi:MAG TPA: phosphopantetheine-binding protein [Polyangiaceae bacterium]|nr:phosphopantetheine-binding protein [Polyangiaceae bacterium]